MKEDHATETKVCVLVAGSSEYELQIVMSEIEGAVNDLTLLLEDDKATNSNTEISVEVSSVTSDDLLSLVTYGEPDLPDVYKSAQRRVLIACDRRSNMLLDSLKKALDSMDNSTIFFRISDALTSFIDENGFESALLLNIDEIDDAPRLVEELDAADFPFVELDDDARERIWSDLTTAMLFEYLQDSCSAVSERLIQGKVDILRRTIDDVVPEDVPVILSDYACSLLSYWNIEGENPRDVFDLWSIYIEGVAHVALLGVAPPPGD